MVCCWGGYGTNLWRKSSPEPQTQLCLFCTRYDGYRVPTWRCLDRSRLPKWKASSVILIVLPQQFWLVKESCGCISVKKSLNTSVISFHGVCCSFSSLSFPFLKFILDNFSSDEGHLFHPLPWHLLLLSSLPLCLSLGPALAYLDHAELIRWNCTLW